MLPTPRYDSCQILRTSRTPRASTPAAYTERVNLAIDYILTNLDQPLRLDDVSRAARFSPFHFHRVFQAMIGETLADFVNRLRLEKALTMMSQSRAGRAPSLTRIALACGFSSSSDFSRRFKDRYNAPPSAFDVDAWRAANRERLETLALGPLGSAKLHAAPPNDNPDGFRVTFRDLPARTVAYVRVSDPYRPNVVFDATARLVQWAESRGLDGGQWLGYQWENAEIVSLEHCRYYSAVEVERFEPEGEIGRFRFPPMTVAEVQIQGDIALEIRALQWLYGVWLPTSGHVPDDQPGFEAWNGKPFAHGTEHFDLRLWIPVRKA